MEKIWGLTISYTKNKAANAAFRKLVARLYPEGVNQTRNVTAQRQNNIQDKGKTDAFA